MPDERREPEGPCEECGNSKAVQGGTGDYLGCMLTGGERYDDPVFGAMTIPARPCSEVRGGGLCVHKPLTGLMATVHSNWNRNMGDGERGPLS